MQTVRAVVSTAIADSPRVQLVGALFDLGVPKHVERSFEAELPDLDDDWRIGAIVGPSGSGKSSIAREAFGKRVFAAPRWPRSQAIVDCFGDIEVRTVTAMLTAVGFSSPPAWIRPFATLSNGEQFRANLARALLSNDELIVYDEFTSVVDRGVAQIGSVAVAKAIRKGLAAPRFVAVTCHYDVLPWLRPDWTLDTADWTLSRRRLRRPKLHLEVRRCLADVWPRFAPHHYLSATLNRRGCRCFLGVVRGEAVAFAAVLNCPGLAGSSRISRLVVLPDWQGVGIGRAFCGAVAELYHEAGREMFLRTGHAMMIRCLRGDERWAFSHVRRYGSSTPMGDLVRSHRVSRQATVSFRYVGESGKRMRKKSEPG